MLQMMPLHGAPNRAARLVVAAVMTAAGSASAQGVVDYEIAEVALPQRRPEPPRPAPPPELPRQYLEAPPLTLEVVTSGARDAAGGLAPNGQTPNEQTQRVVRTADRVLIEYPALGQQWLFEQNPVDPRRVHGKLIIPARWLVIEYTETDLADSGVAGSWLDVMSLGLRPAMLDQMQATGETLEVDGVTARRYVLPRDQARSGAGLTEIWWSDELLIPLRVVHASAAGDRIMEVRAVAREVDESRLRDPSEGKRLLQKLFTKVDVSDWREEYHGNHIHVAGLPCGAVPPTRAVPTSRPASR
jgi:hypothetical protein